MDEPGRAMGNMVIATEDQCEDAIIAAAKLAGWRVHAERNAGSGTNYRTPIKGDRGYPDLTMVKGVALLFIELKRDVTGEMGPGQDEWLDALDLVPGVKAMVVWVPSEQDRLIAALQRPIK